MPEATASYKEAVDAVYVDRVVITHQHDRGRIVGLPKARGQIERLRQRHALFQRAQASCLNGRSIGHGIGEWNAEFDNVGTGAWQRLHDLQRCVEVRIAAHEIGHECRTAFSFERCEFSVDSASS